MEHTTNTTDVLIVGAGPTGLMTALELSRRGIVCRVIDKLPEATQTSKALAIQSRTLELFDMMGIIEEPLRHGLRVTGNRPESLAFLRRDEWAFLVGEGVWGNG